jgi:hypothetical protein
MKPTLVFGFLGLTAERYSIIALEKVSCKEEPE